MGLRLKEMNEWISVKDRLPDDCETVLVYTKEDYIFMFYFLSKAF